MRAFKLYILLVLFSSELFSQLGPGYLGKRFVAGYGFYFSPALFGSNASEASIFGRGNAVGGDMAFNSQHEGFLEFAFKNRTSVGLSCKYYKTTFDNSTQAEGYGLPTNTYVNDAPPSGFYYINGLNFALYFKFYHKRYVAPWGRYIILGPSINTFKCFYDPATMYMKGYDNNTYKEVVINNFGPQGQQFIKGDIIFGWGRSRIAFNRITIDYGLNFQVLSASQIIFDISGYSVGDFFSGYRITNLDYIERTSKRRVREVNKFNVFLKVGVLLF